MQNNDSKMEVHCTAASKLNFACHQNSYAVLRDLRIENLTKDQVFENLVVTIEADPGFLKPKSWNIDRLDPQAAVAVRYKDLDLDGQFLLGLSESVRGQLRTRVEDDTGLLGETTRPIELLAPNEWGGAGYMPELLAAFCMPNNSAIDRILHDASNVLRKAGKDNAIDGYESGSRQRVWEIAGAIYAAVANFGISYAMPPASFETDGQKIRLPSQILEGRVATCLDTALLLAASFEQAGLNPIIALIKDHALVGVWLQPEKLASVTNDEAEVLRKRFQLKELVLIESTFATSQPAPPFSRAVERAMDRLLPESDAEFVTAVDVARARAHRISPLGLLDKQHEATPGSDEVVATELALEAAPALPDFDEAVENEKPTSPAGRIERWHRKLLDLTARNPLLNHRSTKSSITIACPDPGLLEDKLAAGSTITIAPIPKAKSQEQDRNLHWQRTGEQISEAYALDALEQRQVLVNLTKEELDKRLVNTYRKAQTSLQEGGANTLFLALGFLLWKRDDKDQRRFRAPLILLPVSLKRQSVRSGVSMVAHDDEPRFNTTLVEMLRKDFGVSISGLDGSLPKDESGVDVTGIWNTVRRAIVDSSGFEVIEDVVLGHFSFAKYLMWKDLVDRTEDLRKNPVVQHLIDTPRDPYPSDVAFVERDAIDRSFVPADFLTPLPADSSQMASIASAERGKDFIIIGPPGTGKSQTISNLIAHLLGKGKTVLFVSEKTAALDVVFRRLEHIGLGRFCLELHSNKARKTDVLNQLSEAWSSGLTRTTDAWESEATHLQKLRDQLNKVVARLHRTHSNGMTAHRAMGIKVRDEVLAQCLELNWPTGTNHTEEDVQRMRKIAGLLQVQARAVSSVTDTPFQLVTNGDWSPTWERELLGLSTRLAAAVRKAEAAVEKLIAVIDLKPLAKTFATLDALCELALTLRESYRKEASFALGPDGGERIEALEHSVHRLKAYAHAQSQLSCPYDSMAWRNLDGDRLLERWQLTESHWFVKRFFAKRAIRKEMQAGGAKGVPDPVVDALVLAKLRREGEAIDALDKTLSSLRCWDAHNTEPSDAQAAQSLGQRVKAAVGRLAQTPAELLELRSKIGVLLDTGNDMLAADAPVGVAAAEYTAAQKALVDAFQAFEERAGRSLRETFAESDQPLNEIREAAEQIASRKSELNQWCAWQKRRNQAYDADLGALVEGIESALVPVDQIPEVFEAAYCTWWSEKVLDEDEVLRGFSSPEHADAIERFREVDDRFQATTARYVEARLAAGLPAEGDVSQSSQWGLIKREITKRARHKPVRQLMQEAPEAITRLAPCLMMSPLSIAQYLPPDQSPFDVVIFDEASQITVWDAVGAIARGKQVIVAGDPKQMPPTNFFGRSDDDADGDVDYEGDLESILDELRSSNVPELTLNLHYRSRRESLIAFSNDRYYDNGLITFPAPERPDRGVRLQRPEGFYDRGKSRTNEGEARAIVTEIVRRLRSDDEGTRNRTIGVVSFNSEQQSLIQDLLDLERSKCPEIEWAFSDDEEEPVFVKNLETVQGDERDVILFSVTYGPDRAGHMTMNFGPLNREGGERRLNVAITRARYEMIVFSTLNPDMIDLSRTGARAAADLKHFLEYAVRGPDALGSSVHGSLGDFESPFESAVAQGLRDKGWTVHPQIGVSAFRVDLGIVHPERAGVYLAGVECDGAMYHSSAYARERDKIRQSVLEGLGWTLFRVWSTDWWVNKGMALDALDKQIREALANQCDSPSAGEPSQSLAENEGNSVVRVAKKVKIEEYLSAAPVDVATVGGDETPLPDSSTSAAGGDLLSFKKPKPYLRAEITIDTGTEQLGQMRPANLVSYVRQVADVESPVHVNDLIKRITQAAGLQRAGARIQDVVRQAVKIAARKEMVRVKGDFVWSSEKRKVVVRDRSELSSQEKKLDRVSPQEIARAFLDTVGRNFSIGFDDAISEAANDLGFQRVTAGMHKRLSGILEVLIGKGLITVKAGLLSLGVKSPADSR